MEVPAGEGILHMLFQGMRLEQVWPEAKARRRSMAVAGCPVGVPFQVAEAGYLGPPEPEHSGCSEGPKQVADCRERHCVLQCCPLVAARRSQPEPGRKEAARRHWRQQSQAGEAEAVGQLAYLRAAT